MTDARARVEAWMAEQCPHVKPWPPWEKRNCPDCLLAFAAAQRAEEREACVRIVDDYYVLSIAAEMIRARREGPA